MADTAKPLAGPSVLGTSAATIYTVPSSTTTIIRHIIVTNTTAATSSAFYLSIGADAVGTRIAHKYPVPGSNFGVSRVELKGFIVMTAAQILQAFADDATTLTIMVNGVEVVA